ncbi:hypothetical protein KP509_02G067900 [Ceratopteris richardii]|uniref:Uncharacterized protein n=1 Tax=Ceratopteris richardii TaxID=49495 RepID=A0A8T2VDT8_CERRI|nr:hypothetical protein KP509_02G067900 [Ceratopteris richardii]
MFSPCSSRGPLFRGTYGRGRVITFIVWVRDFRSFSLRKPSLMHLHSFRASYSHPKVSPHSRTCPLLSQCSTCVSAEEERHVAPLSPLLSWPLLLQWLNTTLRAHYYHNVRLVSQLKKNDMLLLCHHF